MRSILKVRGIERLTLEELYAFLSCCDALKIDPDWLACVVSFESDGSFSPAQHNHWADLKAKRTGLPFMGAVGLIQFMPDTMCGLLGLPKTNDARLIAISTFEKMNVITQLEYVRRYASPYASRIKSLEDCYLMVFYPIAMGRADDYVLGVRGAEGFLGRVFEQNEGFDGKGGPLDGNITRAEVCSTIRAVRDATHGQRLEIPDENSNEIPVLPLIDLTETARQADDAARQEAKKENT